jgi:hypothetical protein
MFQKKDRCQQPFDLLIRYDLPNETAQKIIICGEEYIFQTIKINFNWKN